MSKFHILVLSASFLIGCKNELEVASISQEAQTLSESIEKNRQLVIQRNKDYQKFSPAVELVKENSEAHPNIEEHNKFLLSSGLPISRNFYEWSNVYSIHESLNKYNDFIEKNKNHKYLKFFKQYESWLLITHYDLLSNNSVHKEVKFLLNELIETEYKGYPLIYYTISYLKEKNAISNTEIAFIHDKILGYFKKTESEKKLLNQQTITPSAKPLPPEVVKMINNRIMEKNESNIWIDKIKELGID